MVFTDLTHECVTQLILKDVLFDGNFRETNLRRDEDRFAIKSKE